MPDLTRQQAVMYWLYSLDDADLDALIAAVKNGKNISDAASGGGGGAGTGFVDQGSYYIFKPPADHGTDVGNDTDSSYLYIDSVANGGSVTLAADTDSASDLTLRANDNVLIRAQGSQGKVEILDDPDGAKVEITSGGQIHLESQVGKTLIESGSGLNPAIVLDAFGGGVQIQSSAANNRKVGFYGATPVVKQTGVAVTAAAIHAALVNLGLIGA